MKPLIYPGNVRVYKDARGHRVVWHEDGERRQAHRRQLDDAIELAVQKSRGTAGIEAVDPNEATLADVANEYLSILRDAEGRTASYVSKQRKYLDGHVLPELGGPIRLLTRAQLAAVAAKVREGGHSDGYAQQLLGALNRLWKYAANSGYVPQDRAGWGNLAVRGKRIQGQSREYVDHTLRPDTDSVMRLILGLRESGAYSLERAVILGAFSGLRWGEMAALEWGDIEGGGVRVNRQVTYVDGVREVKLPKRDKVRETILPAFIAPRFQVMPFDRELVVPSPHHDYWTPQAFHRAFAKAKEVIDWPALWTFHSLRHHFATWLLGKGVPVEDVAMMMGHSSPDVTMRTYIGVTKGALSRARELTETL